MIATSTFFAALTASDMSDSSPAKARSGLPNSLPIPAKGVTT